MNSLSNRIYGNFDKKNEIPKVKLNLPKADLSFIDKTLEDITKDIRDRQDNSMAMEFSMRIAELMKENGIAANITEYTHEDIKENSFSERYGVTFESLDCSEHDKVFTDKIAKLEEDVRYYKDILSSSEKNCDKLSHENEKLIKHIKELESNEKDNRMEFTERSFSIREELKELIINKNGIKINGENIDSSAITDMNIRISHGVIEISGNYMKRFKISSEDSKDEKHS